MKTPNVDREFIIKVKARLGIRCIISNSGTINSSTKIINWN